MTFREALLILTVYAGVISFGVLVAHDFAEYDAIQWGWKYVAPGLIVFPIIAFYVVTVPWWLALMLYEVITMGPKAAFTTWKQSL